MDSIGQGQAWFLVNEDQLRQMIVDLAPQVRHDVDIMADLIREMIKIEREKTASAQPSAPISLYLYPGKKKQKYDPDFVGKTVIRGRDFEALGRYGFDPDKRKVLRLTLSPKAPINPH